MSLLIEVYGASSIVHMPFLSTSTSGPAWSGRDELSWNIEISVERVINVVQAHPQSLDQSAISNRDGV